MKPGNLSELPRLAYSVQEAAFMLRVSQKTIYRLLDRRLLYASKALRHKLITRTSLEKFLAETSGEEVGRE